MKERCAIVIGSGFGGLAVAIRLQAMGFKTTLLEKREKVGGRAYQLRDRGYTFDMGPSLITAPSILRRLFAAAGRPLEDYVELVPLDPFYRVYFHDGTYLDYTADRERMRARWPASTRRMPPVTIVSWRRRGPSMKPSSGKDWEPGRSIHWGNCWLFCPVRFVSVRFSPWPDLPAAISKIFATIFSTAFIRFLSGAIRSGHRPSTS
ncbi:FAD-dependent oxidoreductase [Rhodothermus marinus]|uniref:FAD-dependent oxidoreductase n=1 Tax=Rhodothermus marinus TaxID=29549 RepID=UPI0006D2C2BE|nr:FAD-dependent oxidoreductase [Rhodothermus marinus]